MRYPRTCCFPDRFGTLLAGFVALFFSPQNILKCEIFDVFYRQKYILLHVTYLSLLTIIGKTEFEVIKLDRI